MYTLLYYYLLRQYDVSYLGRINSINNDRVVIYGYNKATKQYSFWKVTGLNKLSLMEVCDSKSKAIFTYRILCKGV